MTVQGWRECAVMAVEKSKSGDDSMLGMLAQLLAEQDMAKERLRRIGHGVTGTPWADVIDSVERVTC